MDGEHIILEGGPADGKTRWWSGGDWLNVAETGLPPVTWEAPDEPLDVKTEITAHQYRRTDRTSGGYVVFEYQRDAG